MISLEHNSSQQWYQCILWYRLFVQVYQELAMGMAMGMTLMMKMTFVLVKKSKCIYQ